MKSLYESNKEKGIVCWITFLSTLLFPILSIELFSGINTHIWTGIIFGFLLSLIIEKRPLVLEIDQIKYKIIFTHSF